MRRGQVRHLGQRLHGLRSWPVPGPNRGGVVHGPDGQLRSGDVHVGSCDSVERSDVRELSFRAVQIRRVHQRELDSGSA